MNAAETITAAIEKLEAKRGAATEAPWVFYGGEPFGYGVACSTGLVIHRDEVTDEDADLIVTLHAAIPAILGILRGAVGGAKDLDESATPDEPASTTAALELARAIVEVW